MDLQARSLIQAQVTSVHVESTVSEVEAVINDKEVSCLPVIGSDGHCFGVISIKDLVHFHANKLNPTAVKAWEVCTHRIMEAPSNISINEAAEMMVTHDVHHIVITHDQRVLGIISSLDVIRSYYQFHKEEDDQLWTI